MKASRLSIGVSLAVFLSSCANPIVRTTYERYADECSKGIEEACYRAWVNTRTGMLGPELESRALYNWGLMLSRDNQYAKAEEPLQKSLVIERTIEPRSDLRIGRRLAQLGLVMAMQYRTKWKFEAGVRYMDEVLPIAPVFQGVDQHVAGLTLVFYAALLRRQGDIDRASRYEERAAKMGMDVANLGPSAEKSIREFEAKASASPGQ